MTASVKDPVPTTLGKSLRVCMVSDFFYPNVGGVENHIYILAQCLMSRGHKVVVVTHRYGDKVGVRWLSRGLKVYYLPLPEMYCQCTIPTFYLSACFLRSIFIRERITHVHGHQAFSALCHEALFHARAIGLPTIFTDHSLFGFADTSSILTNKVLKFSLSGIDNIICVSNTSKENTVLRAAVSPERVFVIPNAVLSEQFTPDPGGAKPDFVTIVVLCRLVYRKGVDLLKAVIPRICAKHPKVRFLIAGDGPKKVDLEQMRDEHLLHERVEIIGGVPAAEARNVMVRGNIFLNTSLTEAFCMAIVEAASCGLLVVSTQVGGIPEVLPDHMVLLASPNEDHLTSTLSRAIEMYEGGMLDVSQFHSQVAQMYSWQDVTERTEYVYHVASGIRGDPADDTLLHQMAQYYGCGELLGKIACCMVMVNFLVLSFLDWLLPREEIDIAPDLSMEVNPRTKSIDYRGLVSAADLKDAATLEYRAQLYLVSENWPMVHQAYSQLKERDREAAERLLNSIDDPKIRVKVGEGSAKMFKPGVVGGIWESLPVGKLREWPPSGMREDSIIASRLVEKQQWKTLETFMVEKFITNPKNWEYLQPLRVMVSSFLALLDHNAAKYPNCIAPWPTNAKFGIKRRARILAKIFRLRAGKLIISTPNNACIDIDEKEASQCARVLTAGNYSRADETFGPVEDEDFLTQLGACYYLKTRGPGESIKFIDSRPQARDPHTKDFLDRFEKSMRPAIEWHHVAKKLGSACPTLDYELPIYRRLRRFNGIKHGVRVEVKNREKLFWVLLAAQYKDMARDNLTRIKELLEESKTEITRSTWEKIEGVVDAMEATWIKSETVILQHLVGPYEAMINSALRGLAEGNLQAVYSAQKQLSVKLSEEPLKEYQKHENTLKFFEFLADAFKNPQTLGPDQILYRPNDWLSNWYAAQAVERYTSNQDHVLLVDESVPKPVFSGSLILILFYSGRFQEALDLATKNKITLPAELERRLAICSLTRKNICAGSQDRSGLSSLLGKDGPLKLCSAMKAASKMPAVRDAVFKLGKGAEEMMRETITAETYLQPALPGELEHRPMQTISQLRIWDLDDLGIDLTNQGNASPPPAPLRVPLPEILMDKRRRGKKDKNRQGASASDEESDDDITPLNIISTINAIYCWLGHYKPKEELPQARKKLWEWVRALREPIAALPDALELSHSVKGKKALNQVLNRITHPDRRNRLCSDTVDRARKMITNVIRRA